MIYWEYPLQAVVTIDVEFEGQEAINCAQTLMSLVTDATKFALRFPQLASVSLSAAAGCNTESISISGAMVGTVVQTCPDGQIEQNDECCKYQHTGNLTYWGRDKMAAISRTF